MSARHPDNPQHYLLSRARAPDCIEEADITEFTLEGETVGKSPGAPYLERFIHGAIYEARPDIHSVVHNHSPSVIPFSVTTQKLKPLLHMCANIGHQVGVWDSHDKFGDTALLVENMAMGRDLAHAMDKDRTILMRGHGATVMAPTVRHAVFISNYLEVNAKLQMQAMAMGDIKFLTAGEVDAIIARDRALYAQPRLGELVPPRRAAANRSGVRVDVPSWAAHPREKSSPEEERQCTDQRTDRLPSSSARSQSLERAGRPAQTIS